MAMRTTTAQRLKRQPDARPGHRLLVVAALLALLSLAAVSCGSSSTEVATNDASSAPATENDTESDDGESSSNSSDSSSDSSSSSSSSGERESPIGDLLGIPVSDDDAMEEYFGQLQRDAEQSIAQCMRAEGFEYTPVDYSSFGGVTPGDWESREFAEEQGFGAAPFPSGEMEQMIEDFTDPNQDYMMSLSEGEREAYQTALSGELPDFSQADEEDFFFEPSGCQGQAYEDVFSFGQVFEQFNDEFESMEDNFEADARIVEARGDWSRCMSDAGFSYSTPEDARDKFFQRYESIMSKGIFEEPDFEDIDPDNPPDDGEMMFGGMPSIKPEYRAELDAIQAEEIEVAVASWDCNQPFKEIERAVQLEMEQEFVDSYGDQIRAALDEAG